MQIALSSGSTVAVAMASSLDAHATFGFVALRVNVADGDDDEISVRQIIRH